MNLAGIEVFVKVVQMGSISKAAQVLGIPITTASGQLAALEKRLGVTLIRRTTRQLHVTQAGEAFYKHCALALTEIEMGTREMAATKTEPEGLLRVTATLDVTQMILAPLISGYLQKYAQMRIETLSTNRLVDLVGEGVDLAIRIGQMKDSSLMQRKFMDAKASLWAAPGYLERHPVPQVPQDLQHHRVIQYANHSAHVKLYGTSEETVVSRPSRITVDDFHALKAFVLLEQGIGCLPDFLCRSEAATGQLVKVVPGWSWAIFSLMFVYPAQRFIAPQVQTFMAYCLEQAHLFEQISPA